jgi:eukaryotic-like serine/threonine-protein kinase
VAPPEPDAAAAAALDAYLADLQAGRATDRAALLRDHPGLAKPLAALDALHPLAPTSADDSSADILFSQAATEFGPYRLLGELGRGGMGVVYQALQVELDRPVALKMILGSHLATDDQVKRFHAEARAAAKLRHPNVVQVYESGTIAGQHYYAMEFIDGPSLDRVLNGRPVPVDAAVHILVAVAGAVATLHARGIVHRDLKPGNILLKDEELPTKRTNDTNEEQKETEEKTASSFRVLRAFRGSSFLSSCTPLLTDFGLAKVLDADSRLTASGMIVGTPQYMAPEQAAGARAIGPWSDVYALGAILYELLTGRPPFLAESTLDTLVQVLESEPTPPRQLRPDLPRKLELICLKCLEKAPEERYPSAAELAADLEHYRHGETVTAQPQGLLRRFGGWARRKPALAARGICLAAVAASAEVNFRLNPHVPLSLHLTVLGLVAVWLAVSWLCQRGLGSARPAKWIPDAWSAADAALFTGLLYLSDNADSPLLVGYPALITASGLWLRVRAVWVTAAMSAAGFLTLVAARSFPATKLGESPHHVVIFLVCLAALGAVVGHLVQRLRVLGRYYEQRAK